jgi:hypothetical protein
MSRNTTLHLEMVGNAARFLTREPQATVPEAMPVARFSEDNIADPNIRKQILQCLSGRKKLTASSVSAAPVSLVACSPMTTLESDITTDEDLICPPPKCLRTRKTAPAAMRDRVEDLKQKRHFSTAHKEETRLFFPFIFKDRVCTMVVRSYYGNDSKGGGVGVVAGRVVLAPYVFLTGIVQT